VQFSPRVLFDEERDEYQTLIFVRGDGPAYQTKYTTKKPQFRSGVLEDLKAASVRFAQSPILSIGQKCLQYVGPEEELLSSTGFFPMFPFSFFFLFCLVSELTFILEFLLNTQVQL